MARPSQFDRDEALDAAMNEIWLKGYEACSVKALSERLGITRSSFYNAFRSQEDLFREVLARYLAQTPDRPFSTAPEGVRVKPLITRTLREICRVRASDPQGRGCLAVNCAAELCNVHDRLGRILAEAILGGVDRMEQIIGWGVSQGEIDPDADPRGLALALQNLIVGLNVLSKAVREESELWRAARATLIGLGLYEE